MSPLANETVRVPAEANPAPLADVGEAPLQLPQPLDAVAAGQIPAVPLPPVGPEAPLDPVQNFIVQNAPALPDMGIGLYEASDLTTVVFNQTLVNEETLAEADRNGELPQLLEVLASPEPQVATGSRPPSNAATEVAQQAAAQRPAMSVQSAPAAPALPPPPAGTANLLARARVRNMGAGPQTPGVKPNPLSNVIARRPV